MTTKPSRRHRGGDISNSPGCSNTLGNEAFRSLQQKKKRSPDRRYYGSCK